jgi:hypothetical protein
MKRLTRSAILLSACLASGCVGLLMRGAASSHDLTQRRSNMQAAKAGDPGAQVLVAKSYCCSKKVAPTGTHNNRQATGWACKAAAQGSADAQALLGDIYSGEAVHNYGLVGLAASAFSSPDARPVVAAAWYSLAAQSAGSAQSGAAKKAQKLREAFNSEEASRYAAWMAAPETLPCEWDAAFSTPAPVAAGD